jgi:hypothetical protein
MINIRHLPSPKLVRIATATAAWGVLFAVVHFYWAAGGTALNNAGATDAAAQAYIGFIAVVGLVSAAIVQSFVHDWRARLGRQRLTLLTRAGGAALVVITAYFLLGGVLFSTLGWRSQTANTTAPRPMSADDAAAGLGPSA